jgi:hypothetical protein
MHGLLIGQVDHEPPVDHGVVLVAVVLIAVVGGLVYGLVRLVVKARAARTSSGRGPESGRTPER